MAPSLNFIDLIAIDYVYIREDTYKIQCNLNSRLGTTDLDAAAQ